MRIGRWVLVAIVSVGTVGATLAAPSRVEQRQSASRETWVTPERKPKDCDW
jgi:hypothetical protein